MFQKGMYYKNYTLNSIIAAVVTTSDAYAKTKVQISCVVTVQLISDFGFAKLMH